MPTEPINDHYDIIIVGARVAGAATAMRLAASGFRVLIVDKSRYGADTLSTHALMRPAVLLLQRWGLLDALKAQGTPAVRKTTFCYSDDARCESVEIDIKLRHGVGELYAPRRTVLDPILVDAARDAGANVRHGVRVVDILGADEGQVGGVVVQTPDGERQEVRASLVIGADGRSSMVARRVGAAPYAIGRYSSATAYGYFDNLPIDGNRWYFRPGSGAGALPTNGAQTLVFASVNHASTGTSPRELRATFARSLLECAPDIGSAIDNAQLAGKLWSFPGMPGFLRQSWGDGWALVGDAGYMSDPITAHGITNALRDADLLARTIVEGNDLATYQATRDDLSQTFFEVSDRVASFDWDIPTVQQYHRIMSQEMGREEEAMLGLEDDSPLAA